MRVASFRGRMDKLCFITPIFSNEAFGGAERLVWEYSQLLSNHFELEILTTTARDYRTWKEFYKPGIERISNLTIRRFTVRHGRSLFFSYFHKKALKQGQNLTDKMFQKWLKLQGPYSPDLIKYLEENHSDYLKFIFFTYLYYPVVASLPLVKNKAICVLTLHDEPMAYFPQFKNLFTDEIIYSFNVPEEKILFKKVFHFTPSYSSVIGMHFQPIAKVKAIKKSKPYFLYMGRIEKGKGIYELIEYFLYWKQYSDLDCELILLGGGEIPKNIPDSIIFTGYVSEDEKSAWIEGCEFLINPSPMESFSIVLMEAWLREKAVLVNASSDTMKNHCIRSNGGLYFKNRESFLLSMDFLVEQPDKRIEMGKNGKRYVEANYSKERVKEKLWKLINLGK
jgi:glycosyltransferase involved in cell wall biosynthesis